MRNDTLTLEEMVGTIEEFEKEFADVEEYDDIEDDVNNMYWTTCTIYEKGVPTDVKDYRTYDRDEIYTVVREWEKDLSKKFDKFWIVVYHGNTMELSLKCTVKEV